VDGVQTTLNGLADTLESGLSTELNLGALANLSTEVTFSAPDLSEILPDGEQVIGESSGVTVDLASGQVTVDLETLLAADDELPDLNNMTPGDELLQGAVIAAIADGITLAVSDAVSVVVEN